MSKLARPAPGDIVVRQERREQVLVYILHTESGPDQLVLRSREEAVERATLTAHRQQVRAWLTIDGQDHTPLGQRLREVDRNASRSMLRRP